MLTGLLANSSTCKFYCCYLYCRIPLLAKYGIHYPQIPLLANSTPFTAKINYLQIQRPRIAYTSMTKNMLNCVTADVDVRAEAPNVMYSPLLDCLHVCGVV